MINLTQNLRVSLCCALAGLAVGCSGSGGPAVKIGVVNLETVLKESGEIDKFQQQANAVSQGLQNEIKQFQNMMTQQLEKKIAEFGTTPNDEQKKQLESIKANQENQLMQVSQRARMYMENMEQSMVASFRQKIRPVVDKLSEEEKFDLIVEDTGFVIAYDTKLDVSTKVAARLKMEMMNNPEGQEGMPQMPGGAAPGPGPGSASTGTAPAADDPLLKMLNSPSLPPTSAPAGSAPASPKTEAPAAPAAAPTEAPAAGDAAKPAETPAGGN